MKKYIIQNDAHGEPIIPVGLEKFTSITNNGDGTSTLNISQEEFDKHTITPAQGRAQLSRDSKLAAVATYIEQSDNEELKIFWEYSTFWDRNTPTVKALAEAFAIDLDSFWTSAKAIEL